MATGQTSTFTFGTSAITLPVISISPPNESCENIALPHLGIALGSYIPYAAGDLVEGDEFTITMDNNQDTTIALRVAETMTWTKPTPAGKSAGANWAFTGYISSVQEGEYATSERSTLDVVVKVAGAVTKTAAAV